MLLLHWCEVCAASTSQDDMCPSGRAELAMWRDVAEDMGSILDRLIAST